MTFLSGNFQILKTKADFLTGFLFFAQETFTVFLFKKLKKTFANSLMTERIQKNLWLKPA